MPAPPPLLQKSIFSVLHLHLANHWTLVCDFQLKFAVDILSLYFCLDPFRSHSHQRKQRSKRHKQTFLLQIWFYFDLRDNSSILYRRKDSKFSKNKHHPWNHHFYWTPFLRFPFFHRTFIFHSISLLFWSQLQRTLSDWRKHICWGWHLEPKESICRKLLLNT